MRRAKMSSLFKIQILGSFYTNARFNLYSVVTFSGFKHTRGPGKKREASCTSTNGERESIEEIQKTRIQNYME